LAPDFGVSNSLPRSIRTSAALSKVPPPATPRRLWIFSRSVDW
jgi:hypothetical protein